MLFFGMSVMSGGMETLKSSPDVTNMLASLTNPFLGVLIGFLVTAVLQSSSATVGIVLLMASQGLIPLNMCFYIILGCNMGSCVSALLASIAGKKMAKRAAWIHFIVNIIGSAAIMLVLFFFEEQIVTAITGLSGSIPDEFVNGVNSKYARDVANTHLIFKVFQVIVCFPLVNPIVKLTYLIVPGEDETVDEMHLEYIGDNGHGLFSTTAAVPNAIHEIVRMGNLAFSNLELAMDAFLDMNVEQAEAVYSTEKAINYMNTEITNYLVKANQLSLPVDDRRILGGLFHVVNDIERIGDHAENVADFTRTAVEDNLKFSSDAVEEIRNMFRETDMLLHYSLEMFDKKSKEHMEEILTMEENIDEMERQYQHNHVERLTESKCDAESGMLFSDLLSNLERVADHGTNIAFSILDKKNPDKLPEPPAETEQ